MPENIKKEIEILLSKTSEKDIADQLIKINDLFLTQYKLKIDSMEIIPIETEIYYRNNNQQFEDKMIHCIDGLQNKHFGQLYFHRHPRKDQNNKENKIKLVRGGVDICLSDGEYYLSILLRTIYTNKELISGINKIQRIFFNTPDREQRNKELRKLEEDERKILFKRNDNINISNIFHQKRIEDKDYKEGEKYKLNSLNLGEETTLGYKHLDILQQKFYSNSRKQKIKEEFKQGANYGKESNK